MTRREKLGSVIAAILLVTAGLFAGVWMQHHGQAVGINREAASIVADTDRAQADADAAADALVRQPEPLFYTFDPPIIVSIKDTDAVLQIGVSLSTRFASTNDALKNDDPALRSAIILALGNMPQDDTESDAGKERMLSQIVQAVNQQLHSDSMSGSVDAAYFTNFVVVAGSGT